MNPGFTFTSIPDPATFFIISMASLLGVPYISMLVGSMNLYATFDRSSAPCSCWSMAFASGKIRTMITSVVSSLT